MIVKNNKEVSYKTKKKATIWSNKPIAEHISGEKHGLEQLGCSHILAVVSSTTENIRLHISFQTIDRKIDKDVVHIQCNII